MGALQGVLRCVLQWCCSAVFFVAVGVLQGVVADTTQALDADWGKFHNPWEHAWPHQVKRGGEGP